MHGIGITLMHSTGIALVASRIAGLSGARWMLARANAQLDESNDRPMRGGQDADEGLED
jgi:hypothetical protein